MMLMSIQKNTNEYLRDSYISDEEEAWMTEEEIAEKKKKKKKEKHY
jgi:hypothetical protein